MTNIHSSTAASQQNNLFHTISITALLVGTLDIIAASIKFYIESNSDPIPVLKYIASGFFGKQAYEGGTLMIVWGIVFHYMIAFLFTVFLFLIYPKIMSWIKNKIIIAILYGLFTWMIMNQAVVPLSNAPQLPFDVADAIKQALILIFMIGLPLVLLAHRYYYRKKST